MDSYCRQCGAKLKEDDKFCPNCGLDVPDLSKTEKSFIVKNKIPLIIAVIVIIGIAVLATVFFANSTQIVKVDNVEFEIPNDYVQDPSRTDVNYDGNVKSSAMGWSNDKNYIEIGVARTPGAGIDSDEVARSLGGSPTKMLGHSGYYQKYDEGGYSFIFGMKDKVCMVYVSNYDAFDDVKVLDEN